MWKTSWLHVVSRISKAPQPWPPNFDWNPCWKWDLENPCAKVSYILIGSNYCSIEKIHFIKLMWILRKPIMVLSFLLQDLNHSSPSKLMDLLWNKLLDTIFINVYAIFFGSPYLCVTFNHNWELNMVMFLLVYPSNAFYIEFAIPKP